jgi:hypothetical protein
VHAGTRQESASQESGTVIFCHPTGGSALASCQALRSKVVYSKSVGAKCHIGGLAHLGKMEKGGD